MKRKINDCFYYYDGHCHRGERCRFRHEPRALRSRRVCELWRRRQCHNLRCPHRHAFAPFRRVAAPQAARPCAAGSCFCRAASPPPRHFPAGSRFHRDAALSCATPDTRALFNWANPTSSAERLRAWRRTVVLSPEMNDWSHFPPRPSGREWHVLTEGSSRESIRVVLERLDRRGHICERLSWEDGRGEEHLNPVRPSLSEGSRPLTQLAKTQGCKTDPTPETSCAAVKKLRLDSDGDAAVNSESLDIHSLKEDRKPTVTPRCGDDCGRNSGDAMSCGVNSVGRDLEVENYGSCTKANTKHQNSNVKTSKSITITCNDVKSERNDETLGVTGVPILNTSENIKCWRDAVEGNCHGKKDRMDFGDDPREVGRVPGEIRDSAGILSVFCRESDNPCGIDKGPAVDSSSELAFGQLLETPPPVGYYTRLRARIDRQKQATKGDGKNEENN